MKPHDLRTRIFLDGGNPSETGKIIKALGFLDGQTTNPTLISKNPDARKRLEKGEKFSRKEIFDFYRAVVGELSSLIPDGSVSVEVYADAATTAVEMLSQGRDMFAWIPNAHVKFPTTREGLQAAEQAVREGLRVNMTLCFTQDQAAAVYAATRGAERGRVFVSPFVGRLDDKGECGMDLIANIIRMYQKGDGHVEVLTASVRNRDHFLYAIKLGSDIITAPFEVLTEWATGGIPLPGADYRYNGRNLKDIPYRDIDLRKDWRTYDLRHELTDRGIERFSADWNSLLKMESSQAARRL
jgi:transaldolase